LPDLDEPWMHLCVHNKIQSEEFKMARVGSLHRVGAAQEILAGCRQCEGADAADLLPERLKAGASELAGVLIEREHTQRMCGGRRLGRVDGTGIGRGNHDARAADRGQQRIERNDSQVDAQHIGGLVDAMRLGDRSLDDPALLLRGIAGAAKQSGADAAGCVSRLANPERVWIHLGGLEQGGALRGHRKRRGNKIP
jgi:hypothetical protein